MQNVVETCKVIAKMQEQLAKHATCPQMCQHWGQHWQDGSKMRSTLSRWNSKCPRWAQDGEEGARRKAMTETCQKHARHASTWANNGTRIANMGSKMGLQRPRWAPTWGQNDQDGPPNGVKIAKMGPRWPRERPERGLERNKSEQGPNNLKMEPTWAQHAGNNVEKQWWFARRCQH